MRYKLNRDGIISAEDFYCIDIDANRYRYTKLYNNLLASKIPDKMPFDLPFLYGYAVLLKDNFISGVLGIYRYSVNRHNIDCIIFKSGVENYIEHYPVELTQSRYEINKFHNKDLLDIKCIVLDLLKVEGIN